MREYSYKQALCFHQEAEGFDASASLIVTSTLAVDLSLPKSVYNLVPPYVLEGVDVPFLLKDTPIMDVHIKLPMIGKTMDAQRGMFGIFGQETELLVELFLDVLG